MTPDTVSTNYGNGIHFNPSHESRASWICYDLEFQLRLVLNSLAKFNFNGACFARIGDLLEKWIDNLMILVIYPIFFGEGGEWSR